LLSELAGARRARDNWLGNRDLPHVDYTLLPGTDEGDAAAAMRAERGAEEAARVVELMEELRRRFPTEAALRKGISEVCSHSYPYTVEEIIGGCPFDLPPAQWQRTLNGLVKDGTLVCYIKPPEWLVTDNDQWFIDRVRCSWPPVPHYITPRGRQGRCVGRSALAGRLPGVSWSEAGAPLGTETIRPMTAMVWVHHGEQLEPRRPGGDRRPRSRSSRHLDRSTPLTLGTP
jgi:hypothetical protein